MTELLIAHGAKLNQRDLSGNTPLLYACHFYRQHGRGVEPLGMQLGAFLLTESLSSLVFSNFPMIHFEVVRPAALSQG